MVSDSRFEVVFLEEAKLFLDGLDEKSRSKIVYNLWKSKMANDKELFKKLQNEIWEFRTKYSKAHYRLLAFWDKRNKSETLVVATHGFLKKTDKIPKVEIARAESLRKQYLNETWEKR
ncbi:MAG: type II toxin-antitoxin system RelE/ParE family toxin [Cryomorphaceae bacterium]|nr:MAG: type II toxin-antitoxin system RelE/ParE family toxin [Cryomorphaceae bacterium]